MEQKRSYLDNFLRWFLWITIFGAGFHGGQLIMITLHGHFMTGFVIFITGVMGYAFAGVILGALIALIATYLPQIKIAPTTIGMGAIRIVVIGLAFGIWSAFATKLPGMADEPAGPSVGSRAVACTGDNIEAAFAKMEVIDHAYSQDNVDLKSLAGKADAMWGAVPYCENSDPDLTDEQRGKYIDVLLLGSADTVPIYYVVGRKADAKKYIAIYFEMSDMAKKIGPAKGWTKMLAYVNHVDPLMEKFAKKLGVSH